MLVDIKYIVCAIAIVYYLLSFIFLVILYRKISKGNTTLSDNVKSAIDETLSIAKSLGINSLSDILSIVDSIKSGNVKDIPISDATAEKLNDENK